MTRSRRAFFMSLLARRALALAPLIALPSACGEQFTARAERDAGAAGSGGAAGDGGEGIGGASHRDGGAAGSATGGIGGTGTGGGDSGGRDGGAGGRDAGTGDAGTSGGMSGGVDAGAGVDAARRDAAIDARPIDDPCEPAPPARSGAIVAHCAVGAPPIVDGDLAEWPSSVFTNTVKHQTAEPLGSWSTFETVNDANLSGQFAVRWDDKALYVAARITDDVRGVSDPTHLYQNDAFEVFLDGNGDSGPYAADDIQLLFDATGRSQGYRFPILEPFVTPGGVTVATANAGPGASWNVEARIPWSVLGSAPRSLGDVIGFDASFDDDDTGSRNRALVWKNAAPSGCSCAMDPNPSPCEPYCHTITFYKLQLGGR